MKLDWQSTRDFVRSDWQSNPLRLVLETICWALNVAVALIFAVTVPDVPLTLVYPLFFLGLSINIYSAVSRGSFGILMTSATMFLINLVGYYRLLSV